MNLIYLDTSALVKLYVREPGTDDVLQLVKNSTSIGTAIISRAEAAAAFSKAIRVGYITSTEGRTAGEAFLDAWPSVVRLAINETIISQAGSLAFTYGLRGYDAVHLATALNWQATLDIPVLLATYDQKLWEVAKQMQIAVWPESF
ncbi:MAG TPA: type II toxin-antitoxin system VapC family toxin [Anaerolineae bacterium]|nr:type II toxin-antitoxin system VapC family toxin [Anaerolineae bacterium]HQI83562.1 type II toxin-antitoxin system VapC family toxin [Anaerolineae bacterium]